MENYQREFIQFITKRGALRFGSFQTKSGRNSPYFFNAGGLYDGKDLNLLGSYYASALVNAWSNQANVIYGPAYKGVPLAVVTCAQLQQEHGISASYSFNRKESKDHGEKGLIVGKVPEPGDKLVIVDDVMTAGTSVRETFEILKNYPDIEIVGILVALDRQERGTGEKSAITEIQENYGVPVKAIVQLNDILSLLQSGELGAPEANVDAIQAYRQEYGA